MQKPLVSIIMPAYNSAKYIKESISSILTQSYSNFELIVINDGSLDKTVEILKSFSDQRVKLIDSKINYGISASRNKGLDLARGCYISFCDSDDTWKEKKLENQINILENNDEYQIAYTNALLIDKTGKSFGSKTYPKTLDYYQMLKRNYICNSSSIFKAKFLNGLRFEDIKHEDYLFWLRLFSKGIKAINTNNFLISYRVHDNNFTSNKLLSLWWHVKLQRYFGLKLRDIFIKLIQNFISRLRSLKNVKD